MGFDNYKDALAEYISQECGQDRVHYKDSTFVIVSTVAYLIGVPKRIFDIEAEPPQPEIYDKLENDKNARIIRNLCRLRTDVERNFGKIHAQMSSEYKGLASMPDLVPVECITQLSNDGVQLKSHRKLTQHVIELNKLISNRINNCKDLFPIWVNWEYLKAIFIMPDGLNEAKLRDAANEYYDNYNFYPYQMYMNWPPSDAGNILFNDKKFVTLLYYWNNDEFSDFSKVSDVSSETKNSIYDFIEDSGKTVFVVDCENSDPYNFCAALKNLDEKYLQKISKIILFDDVNTTAAWESLESFTSVPVEHRIIERIKLNKSLVDIKLAVETSREFYENNVDSFVLVASDSDYWGLISSIPDARFLVMLEHEKTGPDIKNALYNSGIFYCFIDDFYSANSQDIKISVLLKETRRYLDRSVQVNVNEMMDNIYRATRAEMTDAEKKQFYNKYIKPMYVEIDDGGNLTIQLKKK